MLFFFFILKNQVSVKTVLSIVPNAQHLSRWESCGSQWFLMQICLFLVISETGLPQPRDLPTGYVAQKEGLGILILLPLPPTRWDCRRVLKETIHVKYDAQKEYMWEGGRSWEATPLLLRLGNPQGQGRWCRRGLLVWCHFALCSEAWGWGNKKEGQRQFVK